MTSFERFCKKLHSLICYEWNPVFRYKTNREYAKLMATAKERGRNREQNKNV